MKRRAIVFAVAALVVACNGEFDFGVPGEDAGFDAGVVDAAANDGTTAPEATAPCAKDSDCPVASLHCDVASGVCVACIDDAQCTTPGFPRCDAALHQCVPCGSDVDCPSGQICAASAKQCVMPCAEGPTEHDCPADAPTCDEVDMFCVRCMSDAQCAAITDDGHYCDMNSGKCVYCLSDAQCSGSKPRCDTTHGKCVGCLTSADCVAPQYCDPTSLACL